MTGSGFSAELSESSKLLAYNLGKARAKLDVLKAQPEIDKKRKVTDNKTTENDNNGGRENGSENTEVLAGRESVRETDRGQDSQWKQSENSRKIQEWVGDRSNGRGTRQEIRAGSEGWIRRNGKDGSNLLRSGKSFLRDLSRKRLRDTDSAGRKLSKDLQEKFKDTVLKDEDGSILSLYHWTNAEFDRFELGDIGFHFGTSDAAHARQATVERREGKGKRIYKEVYLNIKNPIFIDFDPMKWTAMPTAYKLNQQGVISNQELNDLGRLDGFELGGYNSEAATALRELLSEKGYDGILYENGFEGGISAIAFDTNQIYTVAENGVDIENSVEHKEKNGGNINDSRDTEILAGRISVREADRGRDSQWKQSENSRKIQEWVGDRDNGRGTRQEIRAGSEGWIRGNGESQSNILRSRKSFLRDLSRKRLKDTDSAGRKLSKDLQEKFKDTVLKDRDGTILSLYHWTNAEFDRFELGDIGFHFGTLDAAHERYKYIEKTKGTTNSIYKEVYLDIRNPVFIDFDPITWSTMPVAYKLNQQGVISDQELNDLSKLDGFELGGYNSEAATALRELLSEKGYDGILYENGFEGGISAIAFNADQIYTVAENGIDIENSLDIERETGKVLFDGDKLSLNKIKRESLKGLEILAQVLKKDFHIYESYKLNGKRVYKDARGIVKSAPNGMYHQSDGSIWIDINAGNRGQGVVLHTAAHELTHFIKQWSPQKFRVLSDFLVEKYGEKGISVDELVRKQIQKAKENGRTISYDEAFEEFVADSMTTMLTDGKVIKELYKKDMTLAEKIKSWIDSSLRKIKAIYKDYELETEEGKIVSDMKDSFEKIQSLFADALSDASDNFAKADVQTQKNTTQEGDVKLQAREYDANGNSYWQIEEDKDTFKGIKSVQGLKKAAYNYILRGDKGNKVVGLIDGKNLEFIRVSAKEYVYGTASQSLSEEAYKQKMRMSTSVIDLIDNASITYDAPDHKNHKLFPNGFKNYQGRVGIDETIFRYIVRVGKAKNGMIFYDINLEVDGKVPRANRTSLIKASTSDNKVSQNEPVVNTYSMQEDKNNSQRHSDRITASMSDGAIERMREAFAKALVDASENFNAADIQAQKNTTTEGGVRLSERDYPIDPKVASIVNSSIATKKDNMHTLSAITQEQNNAINKLVNQTGNDLYRGKYTGGNHRFSDTMVKHALKEHGDFLREGLRAQLPITENDIARHLSAIKDNKRPSNIAPTRTKRGNPSIVTSYEINGYTLFAEEITKSPGNNLPSDLVGHTMYKAPTLATAAALATSARALPKRQSMVLCEYNTSNSDNLSRGEFIADKNGDPAKLIFIKEGKNPKADMVLGGLIALSSDMLNFTDSSKNIDEGYVRCKKPYYITQNNRVFSNSETDVASRLNELKKEGYDCFVFDYKPGDNYMVAVFNKEQIIEDKPTRFSDRDYSAVSNRSLLADALESAAQNDIEKSKLSEYKAKIEEMDKQSQKLSDLRREIKELSFAKGPRDKAKIRSLQDEAIKTANRIDIYDKQLLRLEAAKPLQNFLVRVVVKNINQDDNISRALKQGDLMNEFYSALSKKQWRLFYEIIDNYSYKKRRKLGDKISAVVDNRLVVAEKQQISKNKQDFVVTDLFELSGAESNYLLYEIQEVLENERYSNVSEGIRETWSVFCKRDGSFGVLRRYDTNSATFISDNSRRGQSRSSYAQYRGIGEGTDGGRILVDNQQNSYRDDQIKNSDRDYSAISNRGLLINALESTVQN